VNTAQDHSQLETVNELLAERFSGESVWHSFRLEGTRYAETGNRGYPISSQTSGQLVTRDDWLFWLSIVWVIGFSAMVVWLFLS
jgi:hypothetical protein